MAPIYRVTAWGLAKTDTHEKGSLDLSEEEAKEISTRLGDLNRQWSEAWEKYVKPVSEQQDKLKADLKARAEEQKKARMKARRAGPVGVCQKCRAMVKEEFVGWDGKHITPAGAKPCGGDVLKGVGA